METNAVAAALIAAGGLGLLWLVKMLLVGAMALAAAAVRRLRAGVGGRGAELAQLTVWRGIQVCVMLLFMTALNNLLVMSQLG